MADHFINHWRTIPMIEARAEYAEPESYEYLGVDQQLAALIVAVAPGGPQDCDRCLGGRFRTTPTVEFGTWPELQPPPSRRQFGSV
jgi:hypothetical protein